MVVMRITTAQSLLLCVIFISKAVASAQKTLTVPQIPSAMLTFADPNVKATMIVNLGSIVMKKNAKGVTSQINVSCPIRFVRNH